MKSIWPLVRIPLIIFFICILLYAPAGFIFNLPIDIMTYVYLLTVLSGVILLIDCKSRQISTLKAFYAYIVLYGLISAGITLVFAFGMSIQGNSSDIFFGFIASFVYSLAICFAVSIVLSTIFTGIYRLLLFKKDTDTTEST